MNALDDYACSQKSLYPFLLCIQRDLNQRERRDRLTQCCCESSSPLGFLLQKSSLQIYSPHSLCSFILDQQRSTGERSSSSASMSVPVLDVLCSPTQTVLCFTSRHNALKFSAWNSHRLSCLEQLLSVLLQIPSCVWSPKMIRLEYVWILQSDTCHGRDSSIIQANQQCIRHALTR